MSKFKWIEKRDSLIPNAGSGVFALQTIPKNTVLGEYSGKIVTYADDFDFTYAFGVGKNKVVIGDTILAYINDIIDFRPLNRKETRNFDNHILPEYDLKYNCDWKINRKLQKVYVITTKPIKLGDELYINYGNDYWTQMFNTNGYLHSL